MHAKIILSVAIALQFALTANTTAAQTSFTSEISQLRTHDANHFPNWAAPNFWFSLKHLAAAGNCSTHEGSVLFVGADKQMLALALTAMSSGRAITVTVDESAQRVNGFCKALYVTISG